MATEAVERRSAHIRAVTVTALCSLAGLVAGIASAAFATGPGDVTALLILAALILVQFPVLKFTGLIEDFSTKDQLFIAFMSACLWFVTWSILLTTGVTI